MLIVLPIALLLLTAGTILFIRLIRPGFPALWLIAVLGSIASWLVMLFARIRLPANFSLLPWTSATIFQTSPGLLLDYSSWPFGFALSTLVLAVVLVSPGHLHLRSEVINIAGSLALGGLGLVAVLAANPVTLLLGWAAIDLVELYILLRKQGPDELNRTSLQVFGLRVAGILIAMWTFVVGSRTAGFNTSFTELSPLAGVPLLLSIALRLGIFPLHVPHTDDESLRRGQGTLLRMVPAASGLVVLSRIPSSAISTSTATWLGVFAIIGFVYSSLRWFFEKDDLAGRPFWIISVASCGIISVLTRHPESAIAWGVAMILVGSSVFLLEHANRFMRVMLGIGFISLVGLPLTANASGISGLFTQTNWYIGVPILLGVVFLFLGVAEKILRKSDIPTRMEQIIYLTFPLSILILIASYLFIGLFGWHGSRTYGNWPLSTLLFVLVLAWLIWDRRTGKPGKFLEFAREKYTQQMNQPLAVQIRKVVDFQWILELVKYIYIGFGWVVRQLAFLLEGSAGIFWAILLMVLFFAILNIGGV